MKSSNRGPTDRQRGYALISALILAVLYFGLMELMLIDSTRALREAQRFRARLVAATMAENAAELAARQLVITQVARVNYDDWQGTAAGDLKPSSTGFELTGDATAKGVVPAHATVLIQGHVDAVASPPVVHIDFTRHSQ
ncbi:MAG TPA: hypothetical protein VEZ11_14940 [Thermoanaerobaculia bacterium]|nr:hypothetical protein [Thermoanaerobaculia bacterium]